MENEIDTGHIDSAKYVNADKGQKLSTQLLRQKFPHLSFTGEIQKTGLIGRNKAGDYEVFIRHPWWVPVKQADDSISYGAGGVQTDEHIIYLAGRSYGKKAKAVAQDVIDALRQGREVPYNALSIGKEHESVAHDAKNGTIVRLGPDEQFEFQAGIHEDALPPFRSLHESISARTQQLTRREQAHPGLLLMDTSAPLAGSPNDPGMHLNDGDGGNYIRPWSEHLKQHLIFSDKKVISILNAIARTHGHGDYKALMEDKGFQVLWPSVACQTSVGMPHLKEANGSYSIPLEIAIATADIFNSHVGAVADLLMASSPFVFGVAPVRLRDYRMSLRHIFAGALPGPFIGNTAELKRRWERGGIEGMLYTLDRLAFQTKRRGHEPHATIYGSARVRVEMKDTQMQLGRVENTIAGSSPSLLDEIAHDAFIYLLTIAAHEAVAHGKSIADYYGEQFPHLKKWRQRKKITEAFNIHGASHKDIDHLLRECLALLDQMSDIYQALRPLIEFVVNRIKNMQAVPVNDLQEYHHSPRGPISEVMMRMHDAGMTPLEILKEAYVYQHQTAKEIERMAQSSVFSQLNARYGRVAGSQN